LEPGSTGRQVSRQPAQATILWPDLNSKSSEMSNMIALVLLDFGGTGSMCGIGKGVDADGRAFS
jgi:hypothetical protein